MSKHFKSTWVILTLAALSFTTACSSAPGPDGLEGEEDISSAKQALVGDNGLEPNGVTNNGVTNNGVTNNGVTNNGVTNNGVTNNGVVMSALNSSALSRKFFSYLVSCALPVGQSVTLTLGGQPTTFDGALGLAPAWGIDGGSCDTQCQEVVSACILSRVNFYGNTVTISERGPMSSLATTTTERTTFPNREAAYWGNIFVTPQVMYACTEHNSTLISRSCGPGITDSIMTVRGDCSAYCDPPDATDGYFANCKDASGNSHPTVTVYRQ